MMLSSVVDGFAGRAGIAARIACALSCLLIAACVAHNPMAHWVPSPNYDLRGPILIVLHATEQDSVQESLDTLRTHNSGGPVSAHYLVGRDGALYQLVDDERRAWHAGPGRWGTITDVNSASIGIELVNPGHEWGYRPFPEAQMEALLPLLARIVRDYDIPRANVVGHSDIAPARKEDPGELFDWEMLADYGLALPSPRPRINLIYDEPSAFYLALERWGYDIADGRAAIRAFQRRWNARTAARPSDTS